MTKPQPSMQGYRKSAVVGEGQRSRSPMMPQQSVGNGLQRNSQVYASMQSSKERKWSKAQMTGQNGNNRSMIQPNVYSSQ